MMLLYAATINPNPVKYLRYNNHKMVTLKERSELLRLTSADRGAEAGGILGVNS